jgi:hypothetical protein
VKLLNLSAGIGAMRYSGISDANGISISGGTKELYASYSGFLTPGLPK